MKCSHFLPSSAPRIPSQEWVWEGQHSVPMCPKQRRFFCRMLSLAVTRQIVRSLTDQRDLNVGACVLAFGFRARRFPFWHLHSRHTCESELVPLLKQNRQWFKACSGISGSSQELPGPSCPPFGHLVCRVNLVCRSIRVPKMKVRSNWR